MDENTGSKSFIIHQHLSQSRKKQNHLTTGFEWHHYLNGIVSMQNDDSKQTKWRFCYTKRIYREAEAEKLRNLIESSYYYSRWIIADVHYWFYHIKVIQI